MDRHTTLRHNTLSCDFDPTGMNPEAGCSAGLTGYPDFNAVEFNTVDRNLLVANAKSAFCAFGGSSNGKPFSGSTNHIAFTDNVFQKGANGTCGKLRPDHRLRPERSGQRLVRKPLGRRHIAGRADRVTAE